MFPTQVEGYEWLGKTKLSGLKAATLYQARVFGTNMHGKGPVSQEYVFGTKGADFKQDQTTDGANLVQAQPNLFSKLMCFLLIRLVSIEKKTF